MLPQTEKTISIFRDICAQKKYNRISNVADFLLTRPPRACIYAAVLALLNSMSGNNSVVECNLAKVEVASSNLVSRSRSDYKRFGDAEPFFIN
jgi:hypothetical protein